jgi:hypothetical protein
MTGEQRPPLSGSQTGGLPKTCAVDSIGILGGNMRQHKIYTMSFSTIYPLYVAKAERKGRTKEEVLQVIEWLTGHDEASLQEQIDTQIDLQTFFAKSPGLNPLREKVTGVVCGIRVEDIEEDTLREIRILDKLIDELAKGKAMEKILRK